MKLSQSGFIQALSLEEARHREPAARLETEPKAPASQAIVPSLPPGQLPVRGL